MASVNLSVSPREGSGKGVARRLRAAGHIPAILYGYGTEPQSVSVEDLALRKALSSPAGVRAVLKLEVEGGKEPFVALVKDLQRHPLTRMILHVDLQSIDIKQTVDVSVPIRAVGIAEGVRTQGGNLEWQRRELQLRLLPTMIPEYIEIDVTELQLNEALHIGDVKVEDAEMLEDAMLTICSVKTTRMSVEVETEEGEGEGEGEAAEGEAGADATEGGAEGGDAKS